MVSSQAVAAKVIEVLHRQQFRSGSLAKPFSRIAAHPAGATLQMIGVLLRPTLDIA
jgi:hypothetical protein